MLGECQEALDVELIFCSRAQLHFGQGKVLTQLVALSFVGLSVHRPLVKECLIDAIEALPLLDYSGLKTGPEALRLPLPFVPHVANNRVKQTHVASLRL